MATQLTIPVADGADMSNARVNDSTALTELTSGQDSTRYPLSEDATTTARLATTSTEPAGVSIGLDGEVYTLTLPEGEATLTLDGIAYNFATADVIGKAPLILGGPKAAASIPTQAGGTIDYVPAPYLFDPTGGQPEMALRTKRNGVQLSQGPQHSLSALDLIAGVSGQQEVVNAYGLRVSTAEIVPARSYTPDKLSFTGSQALLKSDGIQPGGATTMLMAMGMTGFVKDTSNGAMFHTAAQYSSRLVLPTNKVDSTGSLYLIRQDGTLMLNNVALMPLGVTFAQTDLILILVFANGVTGKWNFAIYRNGSLLKSSSGTASGSGKLSTTLPWTFGMMNAGYQMKGDIVDYRIWTDLAASEINVSNLVEAGNIISTSGEPKDPAIANMVYGTPKIWIPLNATQANALVNQGSAGNFTSRQGVFA